MSNDTETKTAGTYNIYLGKTKIHSGTLITE